MFDREAKHRVGLRNASQGRLRFRHRLEGHERGTDRFQGCVEASLDGRRVETSSEPVHGKLFILHALTGMRNEPCGQERSVQADARVVHLVTWR